MQHDKNCKKDLDQAQKKINTGMIGVFKPKCEPDGSWSPMQCWGSTGMCHCVDRDGNITAEPSRTLIACPPIKHKCTTCKSKCKKCKK